MIAVIETGAPGEGNRHVVAANISMVLLYAVLGVFLAKTLYGIISTARFDGNAVGVCWTLAVVLGLAALHGTAAYGARRKRHWARTLSRVLAFMLFPAIPLGTVFSMSILRNTRPGRWVSVTGEP